MSNKYTNQELQKMAEFTIDCLENGVDSMKAVMLINIVSQRTGMNQQQVYDRINEYANGNV